MSRTWAAKRRRSGGVERGASILDRVCAGEPCIGRGNSEGWLRHGGRALVRFERPAGGGGIAVGGRCRGRRGVRVASGHGTPLAVLALCTGDVRHRRPRGDVLRRRRLCVRLPASRGGLCCVSVAGMNLPNDAADHLTRTSLIVAGFATGPRRSRCCVSHSVSPSALYAYVVIEPAAIAAGFFDTTECMVTTLPFDTW
jgi:hypothetical protein